MNALLQYLKNNQGQAGALLIAGVCLVVALLELQSIVRSWKR